MRLAELPATIPGRLYLHSMPGRYELIDEFLADIAENNIRSVACLASLAEIRQKSPTYATLLTGVVPWEHIGFPIPNFGVPNEQALTSLSEEIAGRLCAGRNVLIHCNSGLGRTGTVAVAVLLYFWNRSHRVDRRQRAVAVAGMHTQPTSQPQAS